MGGQLVAIQYGGVSWVHQDPVTKSQRITNSAGTVTSAIDLDPWGGETGRSSNAAFQPHRYTSYDRDANGGDDAMMRRYQSSSSRFFQPDPYDGSYNFTDPQSFNRYAYTQNDPVNFVDPSGLVSTGEGGGGDPTKRHIGGFLGGFFGGFGALNWSVTTTVPIPWLDNMRITFTINYTLLTLGSGLFQGGRPSRGAGGRGTPRTSIPLRPRTPYDEAYSKWLFWSACTEPIAREYTRMREDYLKLGGEAFWLEVGAVLGVMTAVLEGEAFASTGGALLPIGAHFAQSARLNQMNSDYTDEVTKTCGSAVPHPGPPTK